MLFTSPSMARAGVIITPSAMMSLISETLSTSQSSPSSLSTLSTRSSSFLHFGQLVPSTCTFKPVLQSPSGPASRAADHATHVHRTAITGRSRGCGTAATKQRSKKQGTHPRDNASFVATIRMIRKDGADLGPMTTPSAQKAEPIPRDTDGPSVSVWATVRSSVAGNM